MTQDVTSIRVSKTFKSYLVAHGYYGETHEAILIRLLGDKFNRPKGDKPTEVYDKKDVDSRKTKKKRGETKRYKLNYEKIYGKPSQKTGGKK